MKALIRNRIDRVGDFGDSDEVCDGCYQTLGPRVLSVSDIDDFEMLVLCFECADRFRISYSNALAAERRRVHRRA